ncbi:MAG: 50S ribosomal protein L9 [Deltaproteobacteria bacterium]|nr:50S ribosomal protein L9 [Deltaproteobacteria bacterium]
MEVILKKTIETLGQVGDVVKVKAGHARNFLLPQGLAVEANANTRKELEHQKKVIDKRRGEEKSAAEQLKQKIEAVTLTLKKESGEKDKLFGAVTTKELADELRKLDITVNKSQIRMEEPIKQLGEETLSIKLHPEVTATLRLAVVKND